MQIKNCVRIFVQVLAYENHFAMKNKINLFTKIFGIMLDACDYLISFKLHQHKVGV